jgi:hypothetical protein
LRKQGFIINYGMAFCFEGSLTIRDTTCTKWSACRVVLKDLATKSATFVVHGAMLAWNMFSGAVRVSLQGTRVSQQQPQQPGARF